MKLRNIIKAFIYAIQTFIRYSICFVILYTLLLMFDQLLEALYTCTLPIAIGSFLGYLGCKQFYIVKVKDCVLYLFFIILCSFGSYMILKNEFAFKITFFICFGFIDAIQLTWKKLKTEKS